MSRWHRTKENQQTLMFFFIHKIRLDTTMAITFCMWVDRLNDGEYFNYQCIWSSFVIFIFCSFVRSFACFFIISLFPLSLFTLFCVGNRPGPLVLYTTAVRNVKFMFHIFVKLIISERVQNSVEHINKRALHYIIIGNNSAYLCIQVQQWKDRNSTTTKK